MICKAAEIILTLSATFKGSADQQSVDVKTDFAFLGHDNLFSQIYMTRPEGQTQVIARTQSISVICCLFWLVKCKFTEPLYKSAWYTLLSLLLFSTYALSIKWEGRNLTKKIKGNIAVCCCIPLRLCSSIARYCDIAVIATALVLGSFMTSWMSRRCALGVILLGRPLLGRFTAIPSFLHLWIMALDHGSLESLKP